jgi:hypothetical protein
VEVFLPPSALGTEAPFGSQKNCSPLTSTIQLSLLVGGLPVIAPGTKRGLSTSTAFLLVYAAIAWTIPG